MYGSALYTAKYGNLNPRAPGHVELCVGKFRGCAGPGKASNQGSPGRQNDGVSVHSSFPVCCLVEILASWGRRS